jgi:nucleotide-binding universal stress UspA family protein
MYRRVLVPIDGSATSKRGLRHGVGLAKDERARVRVLNVIDEVAIAPMIDRYPVDMIRFIE